MIAIAPRLKKRSGSSKQPSTKVAARASTKTARATATGRTPATVGRGAKDSSRRAPGGKAASRPARRTALQDRREAFFAWPIDYIPCREFLRKDAEKLASTPPVEAAVPLDRDRKAGSGSADRSTSPCIARLYDSRLLTKEQEQFYFRRMNWLKFQAATSRGRLDRRRATVKQIQRIDATLDEADAVKSLIITANLRLVVSIAKKFVSSELRIGRPMALRQASAERGGS
jgi:hypothetical protein